MRGRPRARHQFELRTPKRAILFFERNEFTLLIDTPVAVRVLEEHQGQQAKGFGLLTRPVLALQQHNQGTAKANSFGA